MTRIFSVMSAPASATTSIYAGNAPWNPDHTVALARAYYGVSASPLGNGAGKRKMTFWDHGLIAYHIIFKRMNVPAPTPRRGTKPYRPRTTMSDNIRSCAFITKINAYMVRNACRVENVFSRKVPIR